MRRRPRRRRRPGRSPRRTAPSSWSTARTAGSAPGAPTVRIRSAPRGSGPLAAFSPPLCSQELGHERERSPGLLELRDVPTLVEHLDPTPGDPPAELLGIGRGDERVLLAPEDQ